MRHQRHIAAASAAALATLVATPAIALPADTDPVLAGGWPEFSLDLVGWITKTLSYALVLVCSYLGKAICGISGWLINLVEPTRLFAANFDGTVDGAGDVWGAFYQTATRVNNAIAVPFGTAFLTIFFVLAVIRLTDARRTHGYGTFEGFMRLVVMFAIAATLITHAIDIMGGLYWVGLQLLHAVQQVSGVNLADVAEQVAGAMDTPFETVTYENAWVAILLLLMSGVVVFAAGKMVIDVFNIAVLRMAEIYLRCAFAAIPLSLVVNEETRPAMWQYVKRFLAACFLGAATMVALIFAGGVFGAVNAMLDLASVQNGDTTGLAAAFVTLIAPLVSVFTMDAIVRKAGDVSNSIFGLS